MELHKLTTIENARNWQASDKQLEFCITLLARAGYPMTPRSFRVAKLEDAFGELLKDEADLRDAAGTLNRWFRLSPMHVRARMLHAFDTCTDLLECRTTLRQAYNVARAAAGPFPGVTSPGPGNTEPPLAINKAAEVLVREFPETSIGVLAMMLKAFSPRPGERSYRRYIRDNMDAASRKSRSEFPADIARIPTQSKIVGENLEKFIPK